MIDTTGDPDAGVLPWDRFIGYRLYRLESDPNGGAAQWVARVDVSPFAWAVTDPNLPERVTYTYAVSAFDARNESPLSASVSARPKVFSPARPVVTSAQALLGFGGGTAQIDYSGPSGDESQYREFRIYRKEQGLPADQWEMVFKAPVIHNLSTGTDTFSHPYTDQYMNRCRVTEFIVGAVDNQGDETEDSNIWAAEWYLQPNLPSVSTQQGKVRFDVQGFVGCAAVGNGFKVTKWTLDVWPTTATLPSHYVIDPNVGWILIDQTNGQTWAYLLWATVQNLYETTDPNYPVSLDTYTSEDVCVTSSGAVDLNDTACKDLDGSQQVPPPPSTCSECGSWPGGVFGGPPTDTYEWQSGPMKMKFEPGRGSTFGPYSRAVHAEPPPGEAGWRLARGRKATGGAETAAVLTLPRDARAPVAHSDDFVALGHTGGGAPEKADYPLGSFAPSTGATATLNGTAARPVDPAAPAASRGAAIATPALSASDAPASPGSFSDHAAAPITAGVSAADALADRLTAPPLPNVIAPSSAPPAPAPSAPLGEGDVSWEGLPDGSAPAGSLREATSIAAGGLNLPPLLITGADAKTFTWQFFSWDHLGSVRVVTSETGAKLWDTKYLPYGEEIPAPAGGVSATTRRFTGHERDAEDGLDYMKARYYSTTAGAFLSPDPLTGSVGAPQSLNRYGYVRRNPLGFTDPKGLMAMNSARAPMITTGCIACDNVGPSARSVKTTTYYDSRGNVTGQTRTTVDGRAANQDRFSMPIGPNPAPSEQAISLIKQAEGFESGVYEDTAGNKTIGYGHKLQDGESFPNGISEAAADKLLRQDVKQIVQPGLNLVHIALDHNKIDALSMLIFNIGTAEFADSETLKGINEGNFANAKREWLGFMYSGGGFVQGLLNRRLAEVTLFFGGTHL